jgi:hypothetical protein
VVDVRQSLGAVVREVVLDGGDLRALRELDRVAELPDFRVGSL